MPNSQMPTASPSVLERVGSVITHPRLRFHDKGKTRPSVYVLSNTRVKYARLWIENYGLGQSAKNCSVFVDGLTFNQQILDDERSPLLWTDINTFEPQLIRRGKNGIKPIDLCLVYESEGLLHVESAKAQAERMVYKETGVYTFEVRAEANWPASNFVAFVDVLFNREDWQALSVIAIRPRRKRFLLWSL